MADVGVGKEGAMVADHGLHTATGGAGVHGHALADQAVAADRERRGLALVLQILGRMADGGKWIKAGARADAGAAGHHHVAHQLDPRRQLDVGSDHAQGTDLDILGKLGARLDDRRRVHLRAWHHPDPKSWR